MDDNVVKTCVSCNTEKRIENFSKQYSACKPCSFRRVLKRYYKNNMRFCKNSEINMHVLKTRIKD